MSTRIGSVKLDSGLWDDSQVSPTSARLGVVAPTVETGFRGDANFQAENFLDSQADEVQFLLQLPHTWKEGDAIHPHVHFSPWTTGTGNVQFILEYYQANVNEQFPASPSTHTMIYNVASNKQWYHLIADNATDTGITMTGKTVSNILYCRLYRDNTVASNLAARVTLLGVDYHYVKDSLGSRSEYKK